MPFSHSDLIEVKTIARKGRGVFAKRAIAKNTEIERVPVIVIPVEELTGARGASVLCDFVFTWGRGKVGLALGYGSLYNHSFEPNARYDDTGRLTKIFTAIRDIDVGEEITVNYNGEPDDDATVWFDVLP